MDIEKTNFNVVDREILKGLLKVKYRSWYYFHKKYLLSPGQLARSFKKLTALELVNINNDRVSLNVGASLKIIKYRNRIFKTNKNEKWREVPSNMLTDSNDSNKKD